MATEYIFVDASKRVRAEEIVAFITGAKKIKNAVEEETRVKFANFLTEGKIDAAKDKAGAIKRVYELLGGLVRTHEEQKAADENVRNIARERAGKPVREEDEE